MRLFAELEPAAYEEVQQLVQEEKYDSVEQFLRVAAQNQLAIERSQEDTDQSNQSTTTEESGIRHWSYSPPQEIPTGPPFGEHRDGILLFSQYYRFFPLKCALYKLAELSADTGGAVPLKEARKYIAEEVWPIREAIVDWEDRHDIKKQNRKSTGFPKDKDQSMKRFLDHYVGKVQTQKGQADGFGHDLGYVSFQEDGMDWEIQLSLKGSRFIQIDNPLLENGPDAPTLSEEEQAFIITTIRNEMDEEYRFMKHVYNILEEGEGAYTNYLDKFRDFLEDSPAIGDDPSDNNVRSNAGGAISRMVELGILERGRRRGWYNTNRHPDKYDSVNIIP
ncbi:hypothetical protein BRC85_05260 [Halobacteriales archaeon QS_1_69_70]|nr:MAG: hypothetical protein BRC85_05260 [Halobacteriales archaeon QS_1_69_70]